MLKQKNKMMKSGRMKTVNKILRSLFITCFLITSANAVDEEKRNPVSGSSQTKVYKRASDTAQKELSSLGLKRGWNKDKNGNEFFVAMGKGVVSTNNQTQQCQPKSRYVAC